MDDREALQRIAARLKYDEQRRRLPHPWPCPDCGRVDGTHTADCALSFGDEFARRPDEVEVK